MDELIGRLAAKAGIENAVAESTIGIILGFLRNEGPSDKVQSLIDSIAGAELDGRWPDGVGHQADGTRFGHR